MKKLYALLVILIVIYIAINIGSFGHDSVQNQTVEVDDNAIAFGSSHIPAIENFTDKKVNDTAMRFTDKNNNISIDISEIDNSQNISDIYNNGVTSIQHTSTQIIDQNGVTTYFIYDEGGDSYSADIYFNKNGQNYWMSGDSIPYGQSDYFINHCKGIIDTVTA